jgi:hypothetical protein
MESVMTRFAATIRKIACTAAIAVALATYATTSFAFTAEQRSAFTPDAFRLCSSEIPNVDGITACMRKQKASLSPACKAVFDR